tara:strand:+ start:84 stop:1304 length:1221 start_codon:yes stop_codon:yes gene_type:complete
MQPGASAAPKKKPRKPPGLTGLSLTGLAPASSFVLTDTGTFAKGGFRINAGGIQVCPMRKGELSTLTLEQLEPLQTLGAGACGTVRLAQHKASGQLLALKTINIGDQSQRHQLLNEIGVLIGLAHPHLVPFFDAFHLEGQVHLALGYMNGGSLEQLLAAYQQLHQAAQREGRPIVVGLPERVLAHILLQVLCGLQYLHAQGVVHRDLKPANILFDTAGAVRVADFGIAKQLEQTMAMAQSFVGTAAYMAPERMKGDDYSFASDLWAIGVIALECAQGCHPLPATQYELLMALSEGPPPQLPAELYTAELCALCNACCAAQPEARPACEPLLGHPFVLRYCAEGAAVGPATAEQALQMAAASAARIGEWLRATWPQVSLLDEAQQQEQQQQQAAAAQSSGDVDDMMR